MRRCATARLVEDAGQLGLIAHLAESRFGVIEQRHPLFHLALYHQAVAVDADEFGMIVRR